MTTVDIMAKAVQAGGFKARFSRNVQGKQEREITINEHQYSLFFLTKIVAHIRIFKKY